MRGPRDRGANAHAPHTAMALGRAYTTVCCVDSHKRHVPALDSDERSNTVTTAAPSAQQLTTATESAEVEPVLSLTSIEVALRSAFGTTSRTKHAAHPMRDVSRA